MVCGWKFAGPISVLKYIEEQENEDNGMVWDVDSLLLRFLSYSHVCPARARHAGCCHRSGIEHW